MSVDAAQRTVGDCLVAHDQATYVNWRVAAARGTRTALLSAPPPAVRALVAVDTFIRTPTGASSSPGRQELDGAALGVVDADVEGLGGSLDGLGHRVVR